MRDAWQLSFPLDDDLLVGFSVHVIAATAFTNAASVPSVLHWAPFSQCFLQFPTNSGADVPLYANQVRNWCHVVLHTVLLILDTSDFERDGEKDYTDSGPNSSSPTVCLVASSSTFHFKFSSGILPAVLVQWHQQCFINYYPGCFSWYRGMRVGEASNPGPQPWRICLRNIVSADAHMDELQDSSAQCIVWTETSATRPTQEAISRQCRAVGASCSFSMPMGERLLKGAPCFGRGASSGVLICTPTDKQLCLGKTWPELIFTTGRVADTIVRVQGRQVRIIAVYGYHSKICDAEGLNTLLFQEVFHQASLFNMPTLVLGDFNMDIAKLDSWDAAVARGFVDIAAITAAQQGRQPDPTYRGKSRLDFIVANNAALQHFQGFHFDPNGYTDHAILSASFNWTHTNKYQCWDMPFDLMSVPSLMSDMAASTSTYSQGRAGHSCMFQSFCESFEQHAKTVYGEKNGAPLPAKFLGRGKGKLVTKVAAPVTLSLKGDFALQRHWFRRRQQCVRWVRELHWEVQRHQPTQAQAHNLWRKIWSAKGFPCGFPKWLVENDIVDMVPVSLPDIEWLQHVVGALKLEEDNWCQEIQRQRHQARRKSMASDWTAGGKIHAAMLRGERPSPLTNLPMRSPLQVWPQKVSKGTPARYRVVSSDFDPKPGDLWEIGKETVRVMSFNHGYVSIDKPMGKGMYIKEINHVAWTMDPNFIAAEVMNYWDKWWNDTAEINTVVVECAINDLPSVEPFDPTITPQELDRALRDLPMGKARGLDGFSNGELKNLPLHLRQTLLDTLNDLTLRADWPGGLTAATVSLLAKVPTPKSAADARPITVLPTVFRLWSKIHTRKALLHVIDYLPSHLYGSVPGRSAADMAMHLQCNVEAALHSGDEITGFALDLAKAYNTIPRGMLCRIMTRLGIPEEVVRSYADFLCKLRRFFRVGNELHGPLTSIKGVPEGCPLAVVSMILVTWMVSVSTEKSTAVPLASYVDNWALQSSGHASVLQAVQHVKQLTTACTMTLSLDKSFAYSTSAKQRKALRSTKIDGAQVPVVLSFKDLGVSFACVQRGTAAVLKSRVLKAEPRLQTLRLVGWTSCKKARALTRFIAPAVLYGCELSSVSTSALRSIRGKFNAALWGKSSARDHWLAPLLAADQVYEPFCMVLVHRLRSFKRWWTMDPLHARRQWNVVASLVNPKHRGPISYLFSQFLTLGWEPLLDGWVQIGPDKLHIWYHDVSVWKRETMQSWSSLAIGRARDRQGFELPPSLDVAFVRSGFAQGQAYNVLAANVAVGAVFSSEQKKHFAVAEEACCKACGQPDSVEHQFLYCPATQVARDKSNWPVLREAGRCQLVGGLWGVHPSVSQMKEFFRQVPLIWAFRVFESGVSLFTDGTADHPTLPQISCASWAVILAEPAQLDYTKVWGHRLHGTCQTNNRAELTAVIAAVMSADGGRIFTDSLMVFAGFREIQQGTKTDMQWAKRCHFDLWLHLLDLREHLQAWEIIKVKSHQNWRELSDPQKKWMAFQNSAVDEWVKQVNATEWPPEVRLCQQHAKAELQERARLRNDIIAFHTDVAKCTADSISQAKAAISAMHAGVAGDDRVPWTFLRIRVDVQVLPQGSFVQPSSWTLSAAFATMLQDFFHQQAWVFHEDGMSLLELYLFFIRCTGWHVPLNVASWPPFLIQGRFWSNQAPEVWLHETQHEQLRLHRQPLGTQMRTFQRILRLLLHAAGSPFQVIPGPYLQREGVRAILPGLQVRPRASLDKHSLQELRIHLSGGGLARLLRRTFSLKCRPLSSVVELQDPKAVYLNMRRAHRQARRRLQ